MWVIREIDKMNIDQLTAEFQANKSWDKQYRLIIGLGKTLAVFSPEDKSEENLVKGCESLAWLLIKKQGDCYFFSMDSDTRVVKGLMRIVQIIFQGKTVDQIQAVNIEDVFKQFGLLNHLSPSRANGLLAIVSKIKGIKE